MTIEAKVIADSISGKSPRITTFELRYPRFIHAEFMTHRMFSRNASSSRAIPVERQIQSIIEDTAMPVHWGKNQKGMQADEETRALISFPGSDGMEVLHPEQAWNEARNRAIEVARGFVEAGYHKQIVNRILEPFSHIKVVCTATNFDNFFWLRRHKDAQPEIKVLADLMYEARSASEPKVLSEKQWHLPYVDEQVFDSVHGMMYQSEQGLSVEEADEMLLKVSVARCARVSYLTHTGKPTTLNDDLALYDQLVGSVPLHASPAEHQARPDQQIWTGRNTAEWGQPHLSGNFDSGWIQYRKTLEGEHTPVGKYAG